MSAIIIVIVCLFLNALLAASEMAFVSVGRPQLRALSSRGVRSAKLLLDLKSNPERILAVIQVGITLVGAIAAAVSGAGAEENLAPILMERFGLREHTAEALCIVGIVLPLTFFNVVFGELAPKTISLKHPLRIALIAAPWLLLFDRAMAPLITLLEKSTKLLLSVFSTKPPEEPIATEEDFVEIGALKRNTRQYVLNTISAEKKRAVDVMVPWGDVNRVNAADSLERIEETTLRSGHTRLPVFEDGNVVGLLHTKEFLNLLKAGRSDWREHLRPILRFRAQEPILNILQVMQERRSHMAAVYERMNVVGIITLEDIIEEIVGDLFDEDDDGKIRRLVGRMKK